MRHRNLIELHRISMAQIEHALADPELAEALSTLPDVSEPRRRQLLYINAQYSTIMLHYRVGVLNRGELLGHLKVLSMNPIVAEYWRLTSPHRRFLPTESLEARIGRAVDVIMDERLEDLDEWWVVGPAPEV